MAAPVRAVLAPRWRCGLALRGAVRRLALGCAPVLRCRLARRRGPALRCRLGRAGIRRSRPVRRPIARGRRHPRPFRRILQWTWCFRLAIWRTHNCPSNATLLRLRFTSTSNAEPLHRGRAPPSKHRTSAPTGRIPFAHSRCRRGQTGRGAMEHAAAGDAAVTTQVHTRGRRSRRRHPAMRNPPCLKARQSAHTFGCDGRPADTQRALRIASSLVRLTLILPQSVARTFDGNVIFCRNRLATSAAFELRTQRCLTTPRCDMSCARLPASVRSE